MWEGGAPFSEICHAMLRSRVQISAFRIKNPKLQRENASRTRDCMDGQYRHT